MKIALPQIVFGGMSVLAGLLALLLGLAVLDWTGVAPFVWPMGHGWALALGMGLSGLVVNVDVSAGVSVTRPVFVALGFLLAMPASVTADLIIHHQLVGPFVKVPGIILVLAGFVLFKFGSSWMKRRDRKTTKKEALI